MFGGELFYFRILGSEWSSGGSRARWGITREALRRAAERNAILGRFTSTRRTSPTSERPADRHQSHETQQLALNHNSAHLAVVVHVHRDEAAVEEQAGFARCGGAIGW